MDLVSQLHRSGRPLAAAEHRIPYPTRLSTLEQTSCTAPGVAQEPLRFMCECVCSRRRRSSGVSAEESRRCAYGWQFARHQSNGASHRYGARDRDSDKEQPRNQIKSHRQRRPHTLCVLWRAQVRARAATCSAVPCINALSGERSQKRCELLLLL